ncbi:peptide ABC transporter substrate-binding protein [Paraliobacillus sp. JSM ZJ581]|uniref:peptide ABC transporter substrate-binding protein n=1 Tax=Paraliobacillus sp. JSM ZJ581 TaxID=3342118 RepID=UPI0035A9296B
MRKSNWLLLVFGLVLTVFLAACSGDDTSSDSGKDEADSAPEQVLNITEASQIPTMDSAQATDEVGFQFLGSTMDGLYRLDEDAQPVPAIAAGEPEISEDGTEWTIQLRDDAVWSNDEPVTANDFVFAWRRAVDPATGSEYGPFMMNGVLKNAEAISKGEVEVDKLGVEAVSDTELKITLEKPIPYFHSLLTFGTYLPLNEAFVTEKGEDYALNSDNVLYNGPFTLTEWNPTGENPEQWTLVKNEKYWDAESVKLEKINVSVVKETSTRVNLYNTGEIDRANLSAEYVEKYAGTEDYKTFSEPSLFYLKLNQANEALANKNIRKAIAMSINKQDLVDVILANGSIPSNGAVPKDFTAHPETEEDFREINGDLITEDKEAAKELWAKGLEELGVDSVELGYLGGDSDVALEMDAYVKDQLEENLEGLTVEVVSVPFEERISRNEKGEYDIQASGWGPDYIDPNTWLEMWTSTSPYMTNNYNNEEYDSLIAEANNELLTDTTKRYENLLKAEKVLMEDAGIAPLYQRSRAYLWRPSVKGVNVNPMGAHFTYKHAYIEE